MTMSEPVVRPNFFAVIPSDTVSDSAFTALNADFERIGIKFAGCVPLAPSEADPQPLKGKTLLAYFSYELGENDSILAVRNAAFLHKCVKLLHARRVCGAVVGPEMCTILLGGTPLRDAPGIAVVTDRDLTLRDDEIFLEDLTSNRARSTTWLVERDGRLMVRKAFSDTSSAFLENEMEARRALRDDRVVEILERRGNVIYLPYVRGTPVWDGHLFSFCNLKHANLVFDFLGSVSRSGYSMVDINPSAFLFDTFSGLKVVDFEFFAKTSRATDFRLSPDYLGNFNDVPTPKKNGYKRYWYDAIGGQLEFVMSASSFSLKLRQLLHLVTYRLPRRALRAIERAVNVLRNQCGRILRLRPYGFALGYIIV